MARASHAANAPLQSLPLELAEHHMLQVLLPELELERTSHGPLSGVHLTVTFDDRIPAIWRRQQRRFIQDRIADFAERAEVLDGRLAAFLSGAGESEVISDTPFVFRYGNGGALPIVQMGEQEHYALFYRDIPPIGWNLANGASDSRHELLNPIETIERELREEVLLVHEEPRRVRYGLQWEDDRLLERPEFLLAREYWKHRRRIDIGTFEERVAPVTWLHGPDAITVKCRGQLPRTSTGVFLNVSARDFGVEVDRIAKIHVDEGATLLDGETHGSALVDRPVGLFAVDRFADLFHGGNAFVPDVLFCSGDRYEGPPGELERRIEEACAPGRRPLRSKGEDDAWRRCKNRFDLCPVTRQLVGRHLTREALGQPPPMAGDPYRVFISSAGHDVDLSIARRIQAHLSRDPAVGHVFFYQEEPMSMDWLRTIERALLDASSLVVVCTDVERVRSLGFEWQSFFNWRRYGRKPTGEIIPVVQGLAPYELPLPLCAMDAVDMSSDSALDRLSSKIRAAATAL